LDSRQFHLHDGKKGAALAIRVSSRARRNEIIEILNDGTVKIRITASPSDKKANQVLLEFLAEVLGISPSKMEIVAGTTGSDKLVSILDLDANTVQERILEHMD
jgi:uncharacterized protein (TIGR00251 family)